MPEQLEKAFQRSGITHAPAISGQHVVILAAVIYYAIRIFPIPPTIRALVTIPMWLYILIAGALHRPSGRGRSNLRARRAAARTSSLPCTS